MQRQELATLKAEQLKKAIATQIEAEQEKMVDVTTLLRIGIISTRSEIEQHIGYFKHDDIWKAIGKRAASDSVVKESIMKAITDEVATWMENDKEHVAVDERRLAIKFRALGSMTDFFTLEFPGHWNISQVIRDLIKKRTDPDDKELAEDVSVTFDKKALPNMMTIGKLVDEGGFLKDIYELTFVRSLGRLQG